MDLKQIKHYRIDKDWTLLDLSKESGVSKEIISRIEKNVGNPSLSAVEKVAAALGYELKFTIKTIKQ